MGRSQSTPGLVESRGRIPLEDMWISPYGGLSQFVGALPVVPLNRNALPATPDSPAASVSSSGRSSRSHQHTTGQQQPPTRPGEKNTPYNFIHTSQIFFKRSHFSFLVS